MSRTSLVLLNDTNGQLSMVGTPVRADGWWGFTDGKHTISINLQNFTGRIYLEGSLATTPKEEDWFPIHLSPSTPYLYLEKATGAKAFSFEGNFVWVRARLDRSYIYPQPDNQHEIAQLGIVKKILLNH
jgi:hypothetical protein